MLDSCSRRKSNGSDGQPKPRGLLLRFGSLFIDEFH